MPGKKKKKYSMFFLDYYYLFLHTVQFFLEKLFQTEVLALQNKRSKMRNTVFYPTQNLLLPALTLSSSIDTV